MAGLVAPIHLFPMLALSMMLSHQEVETRLGVTALPGLATGISLPRGDPVDPPSRNSERTHTRQVERTSLPLIRRSYDFCDSDGSSGIAYFLAVVMIERMEVLCPSRR